MALVDHALAELGGQERDAGLVDELAQHPPADLAVGARADDQHRRLGPLDRLDRLAHRLRLRRGPPRDRALDRARGGALVGDVLRKLEMDGAGLLLLGQTIGLAHAAGDVVGRRQLVRELGDRIHHRHDVEDLEPALLRLLDRLLAGDHQDRHAAELGIGRGSDEVGRARPQRRQAHAGLAGVTAIGRGHEAGALLVPGQHQLDFRGARQRVEEVEVLLPRHAENVLAAFGLEALDEQIRCFLLVVDVAHVVPPATGYQ